MRQNSIFAISNAHKKRSFSGLVTISMIHEWSGSSVMKRMIDNIPGRFKNCRLTCELMRAYHKENTFLPMVI